MISKISFDNNGCAKIKLQPSGYKHPIASRIGQTSDDWNTDYVKYWI